MSDVRSVPPLTAVPDAVVSLPGSKSITNRALVAAALADGTSLLRGALFADDTLAMVDCLSALGARIDVDDAEGTISVRGTGGLLPSERVVVDARQSGTTARFVAAVAANGTAPIVVDGAPQMRARPMDDLVAALRELDVSVVALGEAGRLPLEITGPPSRSRVDVAASVSSQFASGLLLAGGSAGLTISLGDDVVSRPYIDMTAAVMRSFSSPVVVSGDEFTVGGGYRSRNYTVEPDASAASYFWAAAAITGGRVRILGLDRGSIQGDVAFVDVLAAMGAVVEAGDGWIEVRGGALRGVDVDLRDISDTAPTLAVVAAFAEGPTTISGIGFVRGKESDRIDGPVAELRRAGVVAERTDDGLVVRPDGPPGAARFQTYDDHRMAMAFALVGLAVPGVEIADPGCVAKTFPDYFSVLDGLR